MITKYKGLRTTLALGCFSTYVLLAITKYLNINIQSEIVRAYDDTTPWVALNTLACLFALGINFAIPSLISRHNPQKILSCLLTGVSLMLTYRLFFNNTYTLYLSFFTISVLGGTAQTVSQVLINYALSDKYRAGFMGAFNTFYNLAGASGPFLSIVFFPEYTFELFFCFIVIISSMIFVGFFNKNVINLSEKKTEQKTNQLSKLFSSVTIFKRNKLFFFICLTTCLNMVSVVHLLVFWQDSYNLDSTAAKSLQSVFFLGGMFLTIPLSICANKYGILRIYCICIILLIAGYGTLCFNNIFSIFDYSALFIIGGCTGALISLTSSFIGSFMQKQLSAATAGFSFMRLCMAIFSLFIIGEIIDNLGAVLLNLILAIANVIFLAILIKLITSQGLLSESKS